MASIERYGHPTVFEPGTYSQAIEVTGAQRLLVLSGQVAYDERGGALFPGDFTAQAREVFRNVRALVEARGGTMADVVKITTYLTDMGHREAFVAVRREVFGSRPPASTLLQVAGLAHPGWLIEVEALVAL